MLYPITGVPGAVLVVTVPFGQAIAHRCHQCLVCVVLCMPHIRECMPHVPSYSAIVALPSTHYNEYELVVW